MTAEPASGAVLMAQRRKWMLAAVAGAAAAAGAGWGLWRQRSQAVDDDAVAAIWPHVFETPTGGTVSMQSFRGRPLLLNFWATWCPPCIEEMPLLDAFFKQNSVKGSQVLGLAIDQPSAVRAYLGRTPVSYPIGLAGFGGTELSKVLGNVSGGLPFTVVLAADGRLLHRRMGRLGKADLEQWAALA